jgi:hypothetical protein
MKKIKIKNLKNPASYSRVARMRRAISMGLFDILQAIISTINPEKHMILPVSQNDLEKTNTGEWSPPLEEVVVHTG